MKRGVLFGLLFLLCACTVRVPPPDQNYVNIVKPGPTLDGALSLYVIFPKDFAVDGATQKNSAQLVGEKLVAEFQKNKGNVLFSKKYLSLDDGFTAASSAKAAYLVTTAITKWDDNIPEINTDVDHGEIALSVYDVKSKELVQQALIGGSGGNVTVDSIPMGFHGPEDCLVKGLASWRTVLYGLTPPKS